MARSGPTGAGFAAWPKAAVNKANGRMENRDLNIKEKGQMFGEHLPPHHISVSGVNSKA
jgi:hypothetical protein